MRPGIVHRLDKDTSGIMVVAKTESAHRLLVDDFKNRRLKKEYLALLHGVLKEKTGRIVAPIGRHPVQRQKMAIRLTGGKHAASRWEVLQEFDNRFSLVKLRLRPAERIRFGSIWRISVVRLSVIRSMGQVKITVIFQDSFCMHQGWSFIILSQMLRVDMRCRTLA